MSISDGTTINHESQWNERPTSGPASPGTVQGVVGRVSDEEIIADAIEDGLIGIGLAMNAGFRHEIMANLEAAKTHLRAALDAVRELDAKRNGFPDTSPVTGNPVTANAKLT
jgi:hypothetical protein